MNTKLTFQVLALCQSSQRSLLSKLWGSINTEIVSFTIVWWWEQNHWWVLIKSRSPGKKQGPLHFRTRTSTNFDCPLLAKVRGNFITRTINLIIVSSITKVTHLFLLLVKMLIEKCQHCYTVFLTCFDKTTFLQNLQNDDGITFFPPKWRLFAHAQCCYMKKSRSYPWPFLSKNLKLSKSRWRRVKFFVLFVAVKILRQLQNHPRGQTAEMKNKDICLRPSQIIWTHEVKMERLAFIMSRQLKCRVFPKTNTEIQFR